MTVGVLEDVMEKPGDERRPVQPHVGEQAADFERMAEVGLARAADLALVGPGGEDVGLLQDGRCPSR